MWEYLKLELVTMLDGVSIWLIAGVGSVVALFAIVFAFIGGIFFLKGFLSKMAIQNQAKMYDLAIAEVERRHGKHMKSSSEWGEYNWKKDHLSDLLGDDSKWSKQ